MILRSFLLVSLSIFTSVYPGINNSKSWNIDDILNSESVKNFEISPDGKWVVWTKSTPNKEKDKRISNIIKTSLDGTNEIQMTRADFSNNTPKWSHDGKYIAFTSARDKKEVSQIWVMNSNGGEAWQLTELENGVTNFDWRDKNRIIFSARENKTFYENELNEKKDDTIIAGDDEHFWPVRLFQIDMSSKKINRLSYNSGQIAEFAVSPDGQWVVTNEHQSVHFPYDFKVKPKQFLYNINTNKRMEIFTEKYLRPFRFVWDLTGDGFYCSQPVSSIPGDDYVNVSTLYYFDLKSKKSIHVNLNWKWELGRYGYQAVAGGVLVSLANGTKNKLTFYRKEGELWQLSPLDDKYAENIFVESVGNDGKSIVFTYTTASIPQQIKSGIIKDNTIIKQKQIIKVNKNFSNKNIARTEVISWKGAKGDNVEGMLYYPHNYQKGQKYPLMVQIHGGPSGTDFDRFREDWAKYPNIIASKGAFMLTVNYHGSGNYGLKWVESIKKHYYEYEIPDILSGVDYVINLGLVDEDQLGIMGWSNGSILAIQSVIETDRFKVCCAGAGDVNWTSDYGNCKFGAAFDNAYFGGPPWENPKYYVKKSPLFKMDKVTTPTFICFGTNDTNVPTEQGWEHYRALQQIGKAPVKFLLFPGEPHGLLKLSHQRRKMEAEIAWIDKYLFGKREECSEAFKKDSPLALSIKKNYYPKVLGYYGERVNGKLIPETVQLDSIRISRFEITRAQFFNFTPDYFYKINTDNYPANNISFEQAKTYCKMLSEAAGKNYRLPTENELNKLLARASTIVSTENTLNYWAGYAPTPDEMLELDPKIAEMELSGSLLMEVGSNKPIAGEIAIYDLEGNVAEWCTTKSNEGKILGGAAILSADNKTIYKPPRLDYVGFRVVIDGCEN